MRGPLRAALCAPVFCGRLISLAAPPHGCPNKVSQQVPTSKRAVYGGCRKAKLQDVAFSYLFISLFTNRRKELKACEPFWHGRVFSFLFCLVFWQQKSEFLLLLISAEWICVSKSPENILSGTDESKHETDF